MEVYSRYFDGTRNEMVWHRDHKGKSRNFAESRKFPYSSKFRVSVTPFSNSCISFSIHPVCITHLAQLPSALLACPHNSFRNVWKLCLQLVENLDLRITDAKHSAILTECGCCGEGENECVIKIELIKPGSIPQPTHSSNT